MTPGESYARVGVGSLLLSEPYHSDPYFGRSTVLITEHGEQGDVGFILNKCVSIEIHDLIEEFPRSGFTLCIGGPVAPSTLHYIHRLDGDLVPGAIPIAERLYWSGDFDTIRRLAQTGAIGPGDIKFFLGYSGWGAGQLQSEFLRGDWMVAGNAGFDLLSPCEDLWYDAVERHPHCRGWVLMRENPEEN